MLLIVCLLFVVCLIVCCLLSVVFVVDCSLLRVYCLLFLACWLLVFEVRYLLRVPWFVAGFCDCCVLRVVCCLILVFVC